MSEQNKTIVEPSMGFFKYLMIGLAIIILAEITYHRPNKGQLWAYVIGEHDDVCVDEDYTCTITISNEVDLDILQGLVEDLTFSLGERNFRKHFIGCFLKKLECDFFEAKAAADSWSPSHTKDVLLNYAHSEHKP